MQIQTQRGSTVTPPTIRVPYHLLGKRSAEVESISFHQPGWTYWAWDLDLEDFSLWCTLQSIEFLPLPLNWDVGRSQSELLFFWVHWTTIKQMLSPHTATWLWHGAGDRKEYHQLWLVPPPPVSLPFWVEAQQGHYPEVGRTRDTTEVQKSWYCNSTGIYQVLHHISIKPIHHHKLPYINPLPAQR